ncbi:MAG: hypothetical protein HY834_07370 [Devosia nanyangense]|uniref:Calcium-binding protein n=1 Tax=Devosia nanyangense TaxID=1228055 RepID=A0A933KZN8_9HYPH|nr:hypothetical protein [Devosia nanyangense]
MPTTVISTDNLSSTTQFDTADVSLVINATLSAAPALFFNVNARDASVVVNGNLIGSGATNSGLSTLRNLTLTNNGTITGDTGIVFNEGSNTLFVSDEPSVIFNTGVIRGEAVGRAAIFDNFSTEHASSDQQVFNSGLIVGDTALRLGDGDSLTENDGTIRGTGGVAVLTGDGEDIVRNNGSIYGDLTLGDGTNEVDNTDLIDGTVSFGTGADRFDNSGTVRGDVAMGNGANTFTNAGLVDGQVILGMNADVFANSGEIAGGIISVGGADIFVNYGLIHGDDILDSVLNLGADGDKVTNYGTIVGDAILGAGNDAFDTTAGVFLGQIRCQAGNDTVRGSAAADEIFGDEDNDSLFGNGGDDHLVGGTGSDTLVGGVGADILDGGTDAVAGIDDISSYESATSGVTVSLANASLNTGEAAGDVLIEIEGLAGSKYADTLVGDANRNSLYGNDGNDRLFGGAGDLDFLFGGNGDDFLDGGTGNDILGGFTGNDTYIVDSAGDFVSENGLGETDTIFASVSYVVNSAARIEAIIARAGSTGISLTGNAFAQSITGGVGKDTLIGGGGNDTLFGGKGNDTLSGGAAADRFVFNTALSATANVDKVMGFVHDLDIIQLDDAIFTAIGPSLSASEFYAKAGATKGHDSSDRIIYDTATGRLYFDVDGSGSKAAVLFAFLDTKPPGLDAGDFGIV